MCSCDNQNYEIISNRDHAIPDDHIYDVIVITENDDKLEFILTSHWRDCRRSAENSHIANGISMSKKNFFVSGDKKDFIFLLLRLSTAGYHHHWRRLEVFRIWIWILFHIYNPHMLADAATANQTRLHRQITLGPFLRFAHLAIFKLKMRERRRRKINFINEDEHLNENSLWLTTLKIFFC